MTTALTLLAVDQQEQVPEDVGKAGPLGLLLIVLLLIAVLWLGRSMTRHLKGVPRSFEPADRVPDSPAELMVDVPARAPGAELLDTLRRAPLAIEPPSRAQDDDSRGGRPTAP